MIITAAMMILNFVTEFIWDKFVVFNEKVTEPILRFFTKAKKDSSDTTAPESRKKDK